MNRATRIVAAAVLMFVAAIGWTQTSVFSYQGRLDDNGAPASGNYEMQFKLFDALSNGAQIGATQSYPVVVVTDGVFGVLLDVGVNAFPGASRFLEISVRKNPGDPFSVLAPRTQILTTPYSIRSNSAALADNATQLGGVPAAEYVTTTNAGSAFIRNGVSQQAANFNISGNGLFGGSIGLGTSNLVSPLTIQNSSFTYGWTQTNGTVSVSSYVDPTGGWLGTRSNHPLYFFTNGGLQQMALLQNGNFGIGVVNPTAKLQVAGGSAPGIVVASQANALIGTATTAGFAAVYGENTSGSTGFGLYGKGTTGHAIFAEGNVAQSRDKGGWVKAMAKVNADASIARQFSANGGNITSSFAFSGTTYMITFPFQVDDRFISITPFINGSVLSLTFGTSFPPGPTNSVYVNFYDPRNNAAFLNNEFFIFVY